MNALVPRGRYKIFFVEETDDDRERVIAGIAETVEIELENDEYDITSYTGVLKSFNYRHRAKMTLRCVPDANGVLFRLENFNEEDEDE